MANTGGQTLNDRLNAARYALAGQGLARVVCKATTEELLAPKKKHLDYLLQCTYEANVSIPQMANLLIERTTHNSWIVVFKALITVHHLMCYGNERFTQYLASSNSSFQLSNYLDKSSSKGYDISTYIRRYAKYLNEKALSYRSVALDFAKMKRGKEEGSLRTMTNDKLLKILPILQNQVDALLEFDCTPLDLSNGVINAAFLLLFKDLVRLFACYNDGIINLLEKFFEMQRKQCREALDIYKKFLIRMDKVAEFLKVAETVGVDKIDIPDLTKAPASLLDALEHHVVALEAKGKRYKEKRERENQEHKLSTSTTSNIENDQVKKALEEEAALMNQLKEKHVKDKPFNPFINSEKNNDLTSFDVSNKQIATKNSSNNIIDLFGPNGTNNQTRNILNNSNPNNLPFNSNKTDTNEKLNSQTLNKDQTVLNISSFNKPNNSDLLVLTNNSNAFHNNIFSQNHNITSFYNQFPSFSYNSNTNRYSLVSSFNLVSNPLAKNITLNQNTNINSMPQLSLNQNLQIITNNHHTLKNTFNNRNNLLMQPAFTTANMNPFTSGFASHSTTQSEHQCGSNSRNFEPNFANAFGTSSSSNGLIKKLPPSRPPPPSNKKKAFDAFGDILQPQKTSITTPQSTSNDNSLLSLMNNNNTNNNNKSSIILKGDLDTTLANLAENLDLKSKRMNAKY